MRKRYFRKRNVEQEMETEAARGGVRGAGAVFSGQGELCGYKSKAWSGVLAEGRGRCVGLRAGAPSAGSCPVAAVGPAGERGPFSDPLPSFCKDTNDCVGPSRIMFLSQGPQINYTCKTESVVLVRHPAWS